MNIFEDLIEELKEENLIEETVIENKKNDGVLNQPESRQVKTESQSLPVTQPLQESILLFDPNSILQELKMADEVKPQPLPQPQTQPLPQVVVQQSQPLPSVVEPPLPTQIVENKSVNDHDEANLQALFAELESLEKSAASAVQPPLFAPQTEINSMPLMESPIEPVTEHDFAFIESDDSQFPTALNISQPVVNEKEFFRRRATEEVNSLQIVEHIISAIEREQLKIVPKPYDDISVKMALHDFLKVTEDSHSTEHAQSEFKLMQETESWYSALAHRDKHISIGDLRRYCENTRPSLSSQALVALARFYRNSPFTEAVRNKFDVVVTRLVTKEVFPDKRELVFERKELIQHLSDLYADWSSIPLYEAENDSDVLLATLKIEDFINEANAANTFEDLISADFFNRLRLFKEGIGEKFFSPILTATAIECNVIVGNKYVDLLDRERTINNAKSLEEKYQFFLDQTVSDATSKTLQLVEVLKEKKLELSASKKLVEESLAQRETLKVDKGTTPYKPSVKTKSNNLFGINKWLLAVAVLMLLGLGGLALYVEVFTEKPKSSASVIKVNLDNSSLNLKEYFQSARINRGTFFAITKPSWDALSKDVKEDIMKKTLAVGSEKGYNKIHLMDKEGKTTGYASESGIDVTNK